jgi:uncharacterized protein YgiM (DUF1202 family)
MLRLTLLLCIGMFAALMIAGEDRGQIRPGLAASAAKKAQPDAVMGTESQSAQVSEVEQLTVVSTAEPVTESGPVVTAAQPAPYVEPERTLVTAVEEPVFSLAAVGNEPVPGAPTGGTAATPEVAAGGEGTIWYVNASSVNVRSAPSTEAEVVGKLASGEATLVVQAVDSDWARIVIQGDGVEGFVAMRYLSAEAP